MLKRMVFVSGWVATTALAAQTFGTPGMDGRDAQRGQDGRSGLATTVKLDGSVQMVNAPGEDGGSAYSYGEDGYAASHCRQPMGLAFDLEGASGGNGGDGARGGNGGSGGKVTLYAATDADLANLESVTIVNPGGRAGQDSTVVGRGAPGCQCQLDSWYVEYCSWQLFYTKDGTRYRDYDSKEQVCSPNPGFPVRVPPPIPDGRYSGRVYDWELTGTSYKYFQCTDGRNGRDGYFGGRASDGGYGGVTILVGGPTDDKAIARFSTGAGNLMGNRYALSGYLWENRSGLISKLAGGSNTTDQYSFAKYSKHFVKFDWRPKRSPTETGMNDATISAELVGPISQPTVKVALPAKLAHKIEERDGTTVVTITHVLNSTDPARIQACAKHNAKGSYLCEFSGACIYEDADCVPK